MRNRVWRLARSPNTFGVVALDAMDGGAWIRSCAVGAPAIKDIHARKV